MAISSAKIFEAVKQKKQMQLFDLEQKKTENAYEFSGKNPFEMIRLIHPLLKIYTDLTFEEGDIIEGKQEYGKLGEKCKLPIVYNYDTKAALCSKLNDILHDRMKKGYEISVVYYGSECVYRNGSH